MNVRRVAALLRELADELERGDVPAPIGDVYFIQEGDDGPIKIGFASRDAWRRIWSLQSGNPRPLRLLGCLPAPARMEKRLHEAFWPVRIRGEWFQPTEALLKLAGLADEHSWKALVP